MPHSRSLLRVARRLTSDPTTAEDLVQEALLRAWRGFGQFREGTNARAWLFRILLNSFYSRGRKNRTSPATVSLGESETSAADLQAAPTQIDAVEMTRALEGLSAEHRTVLLLGVVEGFTCQEMAEILNVPIGTVASRLSRARLALYARLAPAARKLRDSRPPSECAQKEAS